MNNLDQLFARLWNDYISLNPQAKAIYDLLLSKNETIVNDHIALRTYNDPRVSKEKLAESFMKHGYRVAGEYKFEQKKLDAFHLQHDDEKRPKVFISELRIGAFPESLQDLIYGSIDTIDLYSYDDFYFSSSGRLWPANYLDYKTLLSESEYAAWVYAFGFRANHFTIFLNYLSHWNNIVDFNAFIKEQGFILNDLGGEVKGSPELYLEQSSTMANQVSVSFSDGSYEIPYCFYEFAYRYKQHNGELFHGFVTSSADKIFESTDVK